MWVASWNEVHANDTKDGKTGKKLYINGNGGSGYYIGDIDVTETSYSCNVNSCPGYDDTLYFPHKVNSRIDLFDDGNKCR